MVVKPLLVLRLSRLEVVVLAGVLNATYVHGLGQQPLGDLTEEQAPAALVAAQSGLRARGLITTAPDGSLQVDQTVVAVLGTCAFPVYSLVLTHNPWSGVARQCFAHHLSGLTVWHSIVEPDIHLFEAVPSLDDVRQRVHLALELEDHPVPHGQPFAISEESLTRARDASREEGPPAVEKALVRDGVPTDTACHMADVLTSPLATAAIIALDHQTALEEPVQGFTILQGSEGYWRISQAQPGQQSLLNVRPIATSTLTAELDQLIARLAPATEMQ